MQQDKSQLINFAMNCGFILGGFWIFKYIFLIGASSLPFLGFINSLLSLGTPLLLFYFLVKYKNNIVKGPVNFWHGVQFSIMLFFFSALMETIIVLVHILWIDPAYISTTYANMIEMAQSLPIDQRAVEMVKDQPLPTPFSYAFNMIMGDVLIGIILALLIVPLSNRFQFMNNN